MDMFSSEADTATMAATRASAAEKAGRVWSAADIGLAPEVRDMGIPFGAGCIDRNPVGQ